MSGIVIGATIGNDLDGEQVVDAWLTRPADATAPVMTWLPNRAGVFADRPVALAYLKQWQHLYPCEAWVLQDAPAELEATG